MSRPLSATFFSTACAFIPCNGASIFDTGASISSVAEIAATGASISRTKGASVGGAAGEVLGASFPQVFHLGLSLRAKSSRRGPPYRRSMST